jgi:hypothetical protein
MLITTLDVNLAGISDVISEQLKRLQCTVRTRTLEGEEKRKTSSVTCTLRQVQLERLSHRG